MPKERRSTKKESTKRKKAERLALTANVAGLTNSAALGPHNLGATQASPGLPELIPPPHGVIVDGNTVVANNPFDDPGPGRYLQPGPYLTRPGLPPLSMHNKPMGPQMPPMSMGGPHGPKQYPPNQPMVFNPANPNAPPIYPCGVCHKEVHDNDQAILCESGCNFWFHRLCTGLTEPAYTLLTQEVFAEWVCDKCLQIKNIPLVKLKP